VSSDEDSGFTPEPSDPTKRRPRAAPGAVAEDPADNPGYGSTQQGLDNEILKRRRIGRIMSVLAVVGMAAFTVTFFSYAIIYAHRFIQIYIAHVHQLMPAEGLNEPSAVLPLVVPMIPATFFSVLGLATMVTCMRFISAYVNHAAEPQDSGSVIGRLSREIGGIIRTARGGGE
jgi:hypothetical protein